MDRRQLEQLASLGVDRIPGFSVLRPEDQARVRADVAKLSVTDPVGGGYAQESTQPDLPPPPITPKKRRQSSSGGSPVVGSSSSAQTSIAGPAPNTPGSENLEDDASEVGEEEQRFIVFRTQVVGVQYYRGLVAPGEAVSLVVSRDISGLHSRPNFLLIPLAEFVRSVNHGTSTTATPSKSQICEAHKWGMCRGTLQLSLRPWSTAAGSA